MRDEGVPFALDECGQLADIVVASPTKTYTCPNCHETVIPKALKSTKRVPHFSHLPGSRNQSEGCSKESVTHLAAKRRLVEALRNGEDVHILIRCMGWTQNGSAIGCKNRRKMPLPVTYDEVKSEYRHNAFRFDVALLEQHSPVFAFEVCYAHNVSNAKASAISIPFVEFDASDVFKTPLILCSLQDNLKRWQCHECTSKEQEERQRQSTRLRTPTQQSSPVPKQRSILESHWVQRQSPTVEPRFNLNMKADERLPFAKAWLTKCCGDVSSLPELTFTLGSCLGCGHVMVLFLSILNGKSLESYCEGSVIPATLKPSPSPYAAPSYVNECPECLGAQPPILLPSPSGKSFVFASNVKALKALR